MVPCDHIRKLVVPGSKNVLTIGGQTVGGLDQSGFSSRTLPPCRSALRSQRIFLDALKLSALCAFRSCATIRLACNAESLCCMSAVVTYN